MELIDHGENSHSYKKVIRITKTTNENYGENDSIQKVVHVYLVDI